DAEPFEREAQNGFVEVVAAELGNALGRNQLEATARERDGRAVEGAAAEIVHDDVALRAPRRERAEAALGKLDRRGGGLVDHAEHLEARAREGFEREVALTRAGIRRHGNHCLERLVRRNVEVAALVEGAT